MVLVSEKVKKKYLLTGGHIGINALGKGTGCHNARSRPYVVSLKGDDHQRSRCKETKENLLKDGHVDMDEGGGAIIDSDCSDLHRHQTMFGRIVSVCVVIGSDGHHRRYDYCWGCCSHLLVVLLVCTVAVCTSDISVKWEVIVDCHHRGGQLWAQVRGGMRLRKK